MSDTVLATVPRKRPSKFNRRVAALEKTTAITKTVMSTMLSMVDELQEDDQKLSHGMEELLSLQANACNKTTEIAAALEEAQMVIRQQGEQIKGLMERVHTLETDSKAKAHLSFLEPVSGRDLTSQQEYTFFNAATPPPSPSTPVLVNVHIGSETPDDEPGSPKTPVIYIGGDSIDYDEFDRRIRKVYEKTTLL